MDGKYKNAVVAAEIRVTGIVQGVGFRPFVYNLATSLHLCGYVLNDESGVLIVAEGPPAILDDFIRRTQEGAPPLSQIETLNAEYSEAYGYDDFVIEDSLPRNRTQTLVSPDIATCPDCLTELNYPKDRRYGYPFINCTNCGPRFTIVTGVPYDRPFTTMADFEMCPDCAAEYADPADRRFHAQPIACPVCGPKVRLTDANGQELSDEDPIATASALLTDGKILAVKGLGGYHMACDARNAETVMELRRRKYRYDKPFALMARGGDGVEEICEVNLAERELLSSIKKPIVILDTKADNRVAGQVAPGQNSLGVMLPYTPLHTLLLETGPNLLVMTSGNLCDEPIAYEDKDAYDKLADIADYFLTHDRPVYRRVDDSVTRILNGREVILRRSRGYVPAPIPLPGDNALSVLGCGAEVKNTFCLTKGNRAFVSHHIGDLVNEAAMTSFSKGVEHFKELFDIEPDMVAVDLHPDYGSSRYGRESGFPVIEVQHHKAHIASVLAENDFSGKALGVAFDGAGLGEDEAIWGGEFFAGGIGSLERIGHLSYAPQPGGDAAARAPWRMAVSYLISIYGDDWKTTASGERILTQFKDEAETVAAIATSGLRSPLTSSAGRLFDAVSSLLGIRDVNNYEGQAAIEMEQTAITPERSYSFGLTGDKVFTVDWKPIIEGVVSDIENGVAVSQIAGAFHNTISEVIVSAANFAKLKYDTDTVAVSGGVFQNMLLLHRTFSRLEDGGYHVLFHKYLPPNDGCISYGQAVIALNQINNRG
ncbi:MAG: carbamoyltransferase HypF [bacterium]|nr:carbamoyltransferase HypF [bacterium]